MIGDYICNGSDRINYAMINSNCVFDNGVKFCSYLTPLKVNSYIHLFEESIPLSSLYVKASIRLMEYPTGIYPGAIFSTIDSTGKGIAMRVRADGYFSYNSNRKSFYNSKIKFDNSTSYNQEIIFDGANKQFIFKSNKSKRTWSITDSEVLEDVNWNNQRAFTWSLFFMTIESWRPDNIPFSLKYIEISAINKHVKFKPCILTDTRPASLCWDNSEHSPGDIGLFDQLSRKFFYISSEDFKVE